MVKCVSKYYTQILARQNIWSRIVSRSSVKTTTKKGDLSDPNKWHGILLLDICSKLISSILASRLKTHFWTFVNEAQYGSLQRKACMDEKFAVNISLKMIWEYEHWVYYIFVDLIKAYNTVNR